MAPTDVQTNTHQLFTDSSLVTHICNAFNSKLEGTCDSGVTKKAFGSFYAQHSV